LREEKKLRVFENVVLRRIFGPRRDEVTEEWRRLHNEELNVLYSSANIVRVIKSRRMRCAGHVARMGEARGRYRVLVGKPDGKRPLGRPRRRWVDNIRMDLQEVGCGSECSTCELILTTRLAQTSPDLATLQGSSCTDIMTCTGGCGYSF